MVVVLVGFMGAGKTTVGHIMAERLGQPFVDSDVLIEQRLGRAVQQVPASAEIVLEGYIPPDRTHAEGPFGEWTGHYAGGAKEWPVLDVHGGPWARDTWGFDAQNGILSAPISYSVGGSATAGSDYQAAWTVDQPASTLWYHPHLHGSSAMQVGSGMAGAATFESTCRTVYADRRRMRPTSVVTTMPATPAVVWSALQKLNKSRAAAEKHERAVQYFKRH